MLPECTLHLWNNVKPSAFDRLLELGLQQNKGAHEVNQAASRFPSTNHESLLPGVELPFVV
jgi:hypothetical protein